MDFAKLPDYEFQVFTWNGKKYKVADLIEKSKQSVSSEIKIGELKFEMKGKIWKDDDGNKCSPYDVITNTGTEKYQSHLRRILQAKLSYPILVTNDLTIIDGYHRVAKAVWLHIDIIKFIKVDLN
jgi:disulfide oxidoreductase YuzD